MNPKRIGILAVLLALSGCGSSDPYPECPQIRQWFKENLPDPKSLEVVKWGPRNEGKASVVITAKYRCKNGRGGMVLENRSFDFKDGKLRFAPLLETTDRD